MADVLLLLAFVAFMLFFALGVCWLWPDFVDSSEPAHIRRVLLLTLMFETCIEVSIWFNGVVRWWVIIVVLLSNIWGMLDAFLRYPLVHDIDTGFGVKQIVMILVKLIGYSVGFKDLEKMLGWFGLVILSCVFSVPILWLVALPIGECDAYHQGQDRVDVDIAIRCWRAVMDPVERAEAIVACRRAGRQLLVCLSKTAPFLKPALLRWDPSLGRLLRKAPAV